MQQRTSKNRLRTLVIGFVGFMVVMGVWGVYLAITRPQPSSSPQNQSSQESVAQGEDSRQALLIEADEVKVTTLARKWCETEVGGGWVDWLLPQSLEVSADAQFAHGLAGCPPKDAPWAAGDKSYFLVLKKVNNAWTLIYKGKNPPCENITAQYGVPTEWTVNIPSADGTPRTCGS